MKQNIYLRILTILWVGIFTCSTPVMAATPDISGKWYGTWEMNELTGYSSNFSITFVGNTESGLWAETYVPELGLFNQYLPVTIIENEIAIGVDPYVMMSGVLDGDSISGTFYALTADDPPLTYTGFIYVEKDSGEGVFPGEAPGLQCDNLPPLFCMGSAEYCSELVLFEPRAGAGYVDSPEYPETNEDRYFSYLRRDLMQLVKYATAKVDCKAADWDYGNFAPMALSDMSEADGSTPGTFYNFFRHPPGTHEGGRDIDTGYYQLYATDNLLRPVCVHYEGYFDAGHCVEEPYGLDRWRQALYIAYLSEHPRVRVIGVDGQIGPVIEDALDTLVVSGWIDSGLRESIPLAYEGENTGMGWYLSHHHHMHTSMNTLHNIVTSIELNPGTLNRKSQGKYITAHIEFDEGIDVSQIDTGTVALILGGRTMLYAKSGQPAISDYNQNGIADLTLKFDRQKVVALLDNGRVEVSITGLADGSFFQANDTVRVLGKQHKGSSSKRDHPVFIPYARPGARDIGAIVH